MASAVGVSAVCGCDGGGCDWEGLMVEGLTEAEL